MPIRPYLGSHVFEPALIREMGEAFQKLCHLCNLNSESDSKTLRRLGEAVIAAAKAGASDADSLYMGARAQLGLDKPKSPARPQRAAPHQANGR
jgi:hypothetical protein